ncbi:pseudouridine synthase [Candidatus Margulisiibacteriota bacterium]
MKKIKLENFISAQTEYSRRKIFELFREKKVLINGNIVNNLFQEINPNKDVVKVAGKDLTGLVKYYYYKFNKPNGIISTMDDPKNRKSLTAYLEKAPKSIFPIGRLDRNTTGLLLFTNNGEFANRISHPRYKLEKKYKVTLNKTITKRHFERLTAGFFLDDGPVVFHKVELESEQELIVWISEGRNRIIRRSFHLLEYEVIKLKRLAIGPIELANLSEGKLSSLSNSEIRAVFNQLQLKIK